MAIPQHRHHLPLRVSLCLLAVLAALPLRATAETDTAASLASHIVEVSGRPGGMCTVIGSKNADLALALAERGRYVIQNLFLDAPSLAGARKVIRTEGRYGDVSANLLEGSRLPYTDSLINIVVVESAPKGLTGAELLRITAPLGTIVVRADAGITGLDGAQTVRIAGAAWLQVRKPWPADIDEWPHYLHGADGNPVANDRVVAPPKHYQWRSGPRWLRSHETDSSISTLVTARGRLFYIFDEAPISLVGDHDLPDKWSLVAQDAFNGVILWKVPIRRWGWREWKNSWFNTRPGDVPLNLQKRLVAAGDKVYITLGYHAPVSEVNARTGEILRSFDGTEKTNEILYLDGTLICSILREDGVKIMSVDVATGRTNWVTETVYAGSTTDYIRWKAMRGATKPAKLDPAPNIATDGKTVALIDGEKIVAVDYRTGVEKWSAAFPTAEADRKAGGIKAGNTLWVGTMIVSNGVVLHASPNRLAGYDGDSGKLLWDQPKKYIGHLWYEWKDVFVIDGLVWTWGEDLLREPYGKKEKQHSLFPQTAKGYDIKTGEPRKTVSLGRIFKANHHHRCYRNKATTRFILASRRGTEYVSLEGEKHTVHNWVRGTCHMGMMPANGFQYAPPHPCACYINEKISSMNALAPARPGDDMMSGPTPISGQLVKGPAYGASSPPEVQDGDWPAFRGNSQRTGSVDTTIADSADQAWKVELGTKLSPPVVADGKLFVALVDQHHVACLDAETGREIWAYAAGARVDSPPTYHNGTVLFGSTDGHIYCVRASDGVLAWKMRIAPEDRLIGSYGQLESAWPVHGSVLVEKGIVYAVAGRSSQLDGGIQIFGLDASTGEIRHQTKLQGPDYTEGDFDVNNGLPQGALTDVLLCADGKIFMHRETFDLELKRQRGGPQLSANYGMLDETYFKRTPWRFNREYGRLIVHDKRSVFYVRQFDSLAGLDPSVYFTPAAKGYLLFSKEAKGNKKPWAKRVPVRIQAMVLTPNRLFVAGPPDLMDVKDPLGAFEGRKGGLLYAVDYASGEKLAEHKLPSPPVFNGAAAARGRLYICDEAGVITCFSAQ